MEYLTEGTCKIGVVEIGNYVFIGHGAIIMCNVRIGDYAVIGAGSVVTHDVPAHTVMRGTLRVLSKQQKIFNSNI